MCRFDDTIHYFKIQKFSMKIFQFVLDSLLTMHYCQNIDFFLSNNDISIISLIDDISMSILHG